MLSGCGTGTSSSSSETTTEAASSSKSSSTDNEENKVYGVVKSVSSDSVTIEVGTLNEQSKPDDKQSMITTTGETKTITLTSSTKVSQEMPGNPPQGGGQSAAPTSYTSATEYSEDKTTTGKTYSSTGTDENAVHVTDGAKVTLKDATVSRESEDSQGGDSSSFYGIGAAVLTTDGISYISGSNITTNANGGAGIFSYGDGTTYVSDTTISTKKDTSGGLHVADGGSGYCNFYIAKGCTWTVTGDSTLTNLYNAGTIVDNDGKTVTIKGTDGTVYVKGDSEYTITVSSYSTKADMSGMTDASAWKDYEKSK